MSRPSVIEGAPPPPLTDSSMIAPAQRRRTPSHEGLGIAADDHPSEPFDFAEGSARIRAICRCVTRLLAASPECDDLAVRSGRRTTPEDELKRLCEMLEVLLCRLEVAVDAQRRFVANASHGLRMALTLQRTLLESVLAARHAGRQSLRASCEELLAAGAEHERLFESLLTLASSERRLEHREPTDLRRLTESVLGAHRGWFERRSLTVC